MRRDIAQIAAPRRHLSGGHRAQIPDRHAGGKGGDGARVSTLYDAYVRANDVFAATVRRGSFRAENRRIIRGLMRHAPLLPTRDRAPL